MKKIILVTLIACVGLNSCSSKLEGVKKEKKEIVTENGDTLHLRKIIIYQGHRFPYMVYE